MGGAALTCDAKLYVVTPIFNPRRYASRYRLYEAFAKRVADAGAELLTVEVAFGNRPFVVTESGRPDHLQLRTESELWLKENMINLGIQRLPASWEYVAWVDADVCFARPDWVPETIHLLQHYDVIQLFSRAVDLSPDYEPMQTHRGFFASYLDGTLDLSKKPYQSGHPGFAYAARRSALNTLGGLFDVAILGAGDRHMACALISDVDRSYPEGISDGYKEQLRLWQERASLLRKNVGFMPGTLFHHWHGGKVNRRYLERWKILIDKAYDPEFDLVRDTQGLWQLAHRSPGLRDDIRAYFAQRSEDCIYVPR